MSMESAIPRHLFSLLKADKNDSRFIHNEELCYQSKIIIILFVCWQGASHRVSISSDEKDPFRFRHMIPTDALQVRSLSNTGEPSNSVA